MTEVNERYVVWEQAIRPETPFVVVSMFTKGYAPKAARLPASITKLKLSFALFELSNVDRSISTKGIDDVDYSKPRFIQWALSNFKSPILYVDADCVFCERPQLITNLVKQEVDFAIYNWLADFSNDAWMPCGADLNKDGGYRYWQFSYSIDSFSNRQLACSGPVQYWRNSDASHSLLDGWVEQLKRYRRAPDDECLDLTFNVSGARSVHLKFSWLPKEYARYMWWPYVRPIISHPDVAADRGVIDKHFEHLESRFDNNLVIRQAGKAHPFPRSFVIDTVQKVMFINGSAGLEPVAPLRLPLFL